MSTIQNSAIVTVAQARKSFFEVSGVAPKNILPLNEDTFHAFCSEKLSSTKRQKAEVQIDDRFNYIVYMIHALQGSEVKWYDYGNEDQSREDDEESKEGWFDGFAYSDTTDYTGDFSHSVKKYAYDFPSSWFYTDFEDALFQELHASGKLTKTLQKRRDVAQRLEQLVEEQTRIWDSLTKAQKKLFRPLSENELMAAHKLMR